MVNEYGSVGGGGPSPGYSGAGGGQMGSEYAASHGAGSPVDTSSVYAANLSGGGGYTPGAMTNYNGHYVPAAEAARLANEAYVTQTGPVALPNQGGGYGSSSDLGRYTGIASYDRAGNIIGYGNNPSFGIGGQAGADIRAASNAALQSQAQATSPGNTAPYGSPDWYNNEINARQSAAVANNPDRVSAVLAARSDYVPPTTLGDSKTRALIGTGLSTEQALAIQAGFTNVDAAKIAIASGQTPKGAQQYYTGELQRALENDVAVASAYHHWSEATNIPQAANPYEYSGALAAGILKGTNGSSGVGATFPPGAINALNLPGGSGIQDVAWGRAGVQGNPSAGDFTNALNVLSAAKATNAWYPNVQQPSSYSSTLGTLSLAAQQDIALRANITAGISNPTQDMLYQNPAITGQMKQAGFGAGQWVEMATGGPSRLPSPSNAVTVPTPFVSNTNEMGLPKPFTSQIDSIAMKPSDLDTTLIGLNIPFVSKNLVDASDFYLGGQTKLVAASGKPAYTPGSITFNKDGSVTETRMTGVNKSISSVPVPSGFEAGQTNFANMVVKPLTPEIPEARSGTMLDYPYEFVRGGWNTIRQEPLKATIYGGVGIVVTALSMGTAELGAATVAGAEGTGWALPAAGLNFLVNRVAPVALTGLYGIDVWGRSTGFGKDYSPNAAYKLGGITSTEILPMGIGGIGAAEFRSPGSVAAGVRAVGGKVVETGQWINDHLPDIQQSPVKGDAMVRASPELYFSRGKDNSKLSPRFRTPEGETSSTSGDQRRGTLSGRWDTPTVAEGVVDANAPKMSVKDMWKARDAAYKADEAKRSGSSGGGGGGSGRGGITGNARSPSGGDGGSGQVSLFRPEVSTGMGEIGQAPKPVSLQEMMYPKKIKLLDEEEILPSTLPAGMARPESPSPLPAIEVPKDIAAAPKSLQSESPIIGTDLSRKSGGFSEIAQRIVQGQKSYQKMAQEVGLGQMSEKASAQNTVAGLMPSLSFMSIAGSMSKSSQIMSQLSGQSQSLDRLSTNSQLPEVAQKTGQFQQPVTTTTTITTTEFPPVTIPKVGISTLPSLGGGGMPGSFGMRGRSKYSKSILYRNYNRLVSLGVPNAGIPKPTVGLTTRTPKARAPKPHVFGSASGSFKTHGGIIHVAKLPKAGFGKIPMASKRSAASPGFKLPVSDLYGTKKKRGKK